MFLMFTITEYGSMSFPFTERKTFSFIAYDYTVIIGVSEEKKKKKRADDLSVGKSKFPTKFF